MGHTVKICFSVPNQKEADAPPETFEILAIPNYDGLCISNVDDLTESIQRISNVEIKVMNDFDIAWVTQQRVKFPRVPKRKVKKPKQGSDDEEEEEEEEQDDEEEEDEDEEEEDEADEEDEDKSQSEQNSNSGSGGSEEGSDDDNDRRKKSKKEEKSPTKKPLAFMTGGVKGQKSEKPKRKPRA